MYDEFGWACPQCKRNNISSGLEVEIGNCFCDDCGAKVHIELELEVSSIEVIERGAKHDEEE